MGTNRNIVLCVVFSIITCGIYALYWMVKMNSEISDMAGEENKTSGALLIVLSIITCGIYMIYWNFKMGKCVNKITGADNNHIIYLVLSIVELSIVNLILMQNTINSKVAA